METRNENNTPFKAVHPGGILKEELEARGIKQKDFACQIGMQPTHLNALIKGKRNISPDVADKLERELGIPASFWMSLQSSYELDRKVIAKRDKEEEEAHKEVAAFNEVISVSVFLKRMNVECHTYSEQRQAIREYLGNLSPEELKVSFSGLFRKSAKQGLDERMITTWMLLAYIHAKKLQVDGRFDKGNTTELIEGLRAIFNENNNTISRVIRLLSHHGIRFAVVDKVDKASIDGFSFLIDGQPCIVVTKRYDAIDMFAFSVMHELGHIILHLGESCDKIVSLTDYDKSSQTEREADAFAADALIPKEVWSHVPHIKPSVASMQRVFTKWAKEIGYNKWLILGRAAHELSMYRLWNDGSRKIK